MRGITQGSDQNVRALHFKNSLYPILEMYVCNSKSPFFCVLNFDTLLQIPQVYWHFAAIYSLFLTGIPIAHPPTPRNGGIGRYFRMNQQLTSKHRYLNQKRGKRWKSTSKPAPSVPTSCSFFAVRQSGILRQVPSTFIYYYLKFCKIG